MEWPTSFASPATFEAEPSHHNQPIPDVSNHHRFLHVVCLHESFNLAFPRSTSTHDDELSALTLTSGC